AVSNLKLAMEFNKPLSLPAILWAETSTAEDKNHWMLSLQFREFPAFRCVIGKLIIGEDSSWNHVGSHNQSPYWKVSLRAQTNADQTSTTSTTASAKACGASCGRLCPMPPLMSRCEYLPENFLA